MKQSETLNHTGAGRGTLLINLCSSTKG